MDATSLALTWVGGQTVKNLRLLACKFDLDQSERKSSQVIASARKLRTCVHLRVSLARALKCLVLGVAILREILPVLTFKISPWFAIQKSNPKVLHTASSFSWDS